MILTGNYKNHKSNNIKAYSVSFNKEINDNFNGETFSLLVPSYKCDYLNKYDIKSVWLFINCYYKNTLAKLDPEEVYKELNGSILLSEEESDEPSIRHIISAWFEIFLGKTTMEVKTMDDNYVGIIDETDKRPIFIKEMLEEVIRKYTDMQGFESIRALYLANSAHLYRTIADSCDDLLKQQEYLNYYIKYLMNSQKEEENYRKLVLGQKID